MMDREYIIVFPEKGAKNGRWVLKTEYFGAFPETEIELLKRGNHLASIKTKTRWCLDEDTEAQAALARYLHEELGLSQKGVPIGMSAGGIQAIYLAGKHPELGLQYFQDEAMKLILNRMVLAENIKLRFHSQLLSAKVVDKTVQSITILNKSGQETFFAKYFIDATGDGDLAAQSGCPYEIGRESDGLCQAMTLCFRVINVDVPKFYDSKGRLGKLYNEYKQAGKIKNPRHNICVRPHMGKGTLSFNTTRIIGLNPLDADDITKAEIEAREQVFEIFAFLKENADGMENAELFTTAQSIGVRESRRITGEYVLTGDYIVSCRKFDDAIAAETAIGIANEENKKTRDISVRKIQAIFIA